MANRNSQKWLLDNKISVHFIGNGDFDDTIQVVQEIWHKGKYHCIMYEGDVCYKVQPIWLNTAHHKYGKSITYALCAVWDYKAKKSVVVPLHRLVYLTYKGSIPEGYDIDHIDGDTLNNNIENLAACSRKDNLAKRSGAKNHWYYIKKQKEEIEQND